MFLYSNLGGMGLIGHFDICGERESNILTSETSFYISVPEFVSRDLLLVAFAKFE